MVFIDNKIHTKEQLLKLLNKEIPVICEIPYIQNKESLKIDSSSFQDR